MQKIPVKDFGKVGLIKDLDPTLVPPNGFTEATNVRIRNNSVEKVKGYKDVLGTMSDIPYGLFPAKDSSQNPWWIYASDTDIFTVDNSFTHREVTRTAGDYTMTAGTDKWQGFDFSGIFIMNNGADDPQSLTALDSTPTKFTDLSNWPASTTASVVRPFGNFLVALNVTKSGTNYPYMVKWSHSADPGSVPSSWDETDATKDTGEVDLPDGGEVVDCLTLGDINVVYSQTATSIMRYTGGQSVFSFNTIFKDQGILARDCAVEFQNKHFVVTNGDVIVHDGRSYKSVIEQKLKDHFFYSIDPDNYTNTYVVADHAEKEVWICYPYTGNTYPNRALIWNWVNNTWAERDIPVSTMIAEGAIDLAATEGSYDGDTETFDGDDSPMDYTGVNPAKKVLLAGQVSGGNKGYLLDSTNTQDSTDFTASVTHEGIVFGDLEGVSHISEVYPRMTVSGADRGNGITFYLAGRMNRNDSYSWEQFNFNPDSEIKFNCRVTGKIFAMKIETTDNTFWRLDGIDVKVKQVGSR